MATDRAGSSGEPGIEAGAVRSFVRQRWESGRPFAGMSASTIRRRLEAGVLTPHARQHALRELALRDGRRVAAIRATGPS